MMAHWRSKVHIISIKTKPKKIRSNINFLFQILSTSSLNNLKYGFNNNCCRHKITRMKVQIIAIIFKSYFSTLKVFVYSL